jgi:hypothetical protein
MTSRASRAKGGGGGQFFSDESDVHFPQPRKTNILFKKNYRFFNRVFGRFVTRGVRKHDFFGDKNRSGIWAHKKMSPPPPSVFFSSPSVVLLDFFIAFFGRFFFNPQPHLRHPPPPPLCVFRLSYNMISPAAGRWILDQIGLYIRCTNAAAADACCWCWG